jgi:hypothetical protein
MLYQDADDKILEQDIYVDLNEAERAGSDERVQIVAQVDRYAAGDSVVGFIVEDLDGNRQQTFADVTVR